MVGKYSTVVRVNIYKSVWALLNTNVYNTSGMGGNGIIGGNRIMGGSGIMRGSGIMGVRGIMEQNIIVWIIWPLVVRAPCRIFPTLLSALSSLLFNTQNFPRHYQPVPSGYGLWEKWGGAGGAGWSYYYRRGLYLSAGHKNLHFTSDCF